MDRIIPLKFSLSSPNGTTEFIPLIGTQYIEFKSKKDKYTPFPYSVPPADIINQSITFSPSA